MLRDLSHPVTDGMMAYPGDPVVSVRPALQVATDGVDVQRIDMGSHTGTHVDAPSHTVANGRTMADVSLEELVGDAIVLRVPTANAREQFGWQDLQFENGIPEAVPRIVIIDTGWAPWFGQDRALNHPYLDGEAAAELWRRGMRVLAVDTLSPDETGGSAEQFPVHEIVLGGDGLIVENVCEISELPSRVRVGFFPFKLQGDGAPVRAIAFLDAGMGW